MKSETNGLWGQLPPTWDGSAGPSLLGNPPPLGGSPRSGGFPPPAGPSQEERLWAAAAYASSFLGLWMVGPIVVYFAKKDSSRFVQNHARRAIWLHVAAIPLGILSFLLQLVLTFGWMSATAPRTPSEGEAWVILTVPLLFALVPWLVWWGVALLGIIRAAQGKAQR